MSRRKKKNEYNPLQLSIPAVQQTYTLRFRLEAYWREAVEAEGYERIEDAILGIYRETGSEAETARRLNVSRSTISNKLHDLGEPTGWRGGTNNPYGRKGNPDKDL